VGGRRRHRLRGQRLRPRAALPDRKAGAEQPSHRDQGHLEDRPVREEGDLHVIRRGNYLAFFFHRTRCYGPGPEYGFTRKLNEADATLYFYQCGRCNSGEGRYTRWAVWNHAGWNRHYRAVVQTDGDFVIRVFSVDARNRLVLVRSRLVRKAKWFPNLYGKDGYITANAHTGDPDTRDSYTGSYNRVDKVMYRR